MAENAISTSGGIERMVDTGVQKGENQKGFDGSSMGRAVRGSVSPEAGGGLDAPGRRDGDKAAQSMRFSNISRALSTSALAWAINFDLNAALVFSMAAIAAWSFSIPSMRRSPRSIVIS